MTGLSQTKQVLTWTGYRIGLSSVTLSLIIIFPRRCMSDLLGLDLVCVSSWNSVLGRAVASPSPHIPVCDPRRVHVEFVVDIVAPNCLFSGFLHFPLSIMLHFYSSVTDAVLVINGVVKHPPPGNSSRLVKKSSFVEPEVLLPCFIPALRSTQSLMQWAPGFFPGDKAAGSWRWPLNSICCG